MISQFFVLSARGDTIINRDFRQDLVKNTPEIFFRNVKLSKGDAPPIFNLDGISYIYIKKPSGLYLCMTTRKNSAPSFIMEVLVRLAKIIKDFCGTLTEEAIRKNFTLIYEIIDEFMDFGYPQLTSTEKIKGFIANEPVPVEEAKPFVSESIGSKIINKIGGGKNTISSKAVIAPITLEKNKKNQKDQIFVDIIENISVLFNSTGYVINSSIEGCIQMKSYLQGNPDLKLALNEDLSIGKTGSGPTIDDCNFHENVNSSEFDLTKTMRIKPPEGEFVVMNYRVTGDFQPPFRLFPYIEEPSNYKLEMNLRIKSVYPKEYIGSAVEIKFPVPKAASSVHTELPKGTQGQEAEFKQSENMVVWIIKKFPGNTELSLKTKVTLQTGQNTMSARKELGPIRMHFNIPMYNLSNVGIKYLRIEDYNQDKKKEPPQRWVRYVTQSNSYVCRL